MANRDMFSKIIPNVKLNTTFNADGKEIQVERREDIEQDAKEQEIFDILVAAGYFRARIKGLSPFDKIVGGMTWCIEACDFDIDVDLLFHENLTIGQKIALTEKIVMVIPKMLCPYAIEPHQIQGLDFINIFPVIQWLVKRSVENRAEKADKLKAFAVGIFHNHFSLKSDQDMKKKYVQAINSIQHVQNYYGPRRQYKRKDAGPNDERTRVRMTLLEYGNKGLFVPNIRVTQTNNSGGGGGGGSGNTTVTGTPISSGSSGSSAAVVTSTTTVVPLNSTLNDGDDGFNYDDDDLSLNEIDVDQLLKNLYVANEDDCSNHSEMTDAERQAMRKHYSDLKMEMSIDTKQLSEHSQVKALETTKLTLEKKLQKIQSDNRTLEKRLADEKHTIDQLINESKELKREIQNFDKMDIQDKKTLQQIQELVMKKEELQQAEIKYKEQCRQELVQLQNEIRNAEHVTPEEDIRETEELLEKEKEQLQLVRLQLAKKNRAIVSLHRQIDKIPDRTELAQYQRRFLELYNQVSAKHSETKQFYTLYNTLEDTKMYLTKELSLLNSIYENYLAGMENTQSREQFLKQMELIVDGVKQTKTKVRSKCNDERTKRDCLNGKLATLMEQQRKYASAVKQFTIACQRNEHLMAQLKSINKIEEII